MDKNLSAAVARQFGFDSYTKIMNLFLDNSVDISTDVDGFQKLFNGYYRIRRNEAWRKKFYDYFESIKTQTNVDFDTIIDELYRRTNGNVEASFSSKMLSTIRPDMPILDSQVLTNLSLEIKGDKKTKLENAKAVYCEICRRYDKFKSSSNCEKAVAIFDELFPTHTGLSVTKKIDFFLWALKPQELRDMGIFKELTNEQT